tara:strand:- start:285 stop:2348 length:2064 start_codon:yes stop_codon:yes gene_type:complete
MNKHIITQTLTLVLAIFSSVNCFSQERSCGMVEHMAQQMQDPDFAREYEKNQEKFREALEKNLRTNGSVYNRLNPIIIPVAVHFPSGQESDRVCLEALAQTQIDILNADYSATNSDASLWNSASSNYPGVVHGAANIEFCIATLNHPTDFVGNPIDPDLVEGEPAVTIGYNFGNGGDSDSNWSGYMNFLVKNAGGGILGYSPLGGSIGAGQSVVISPSAFGSGSGCTGYSPGSPYNLGRTVTHELGHFYNLNHTFSGSCNTDDGIADTPNISQPNYGCSTPGSISGCVSGESALTMSYMDYGNDSCLYMFSEGQTNVVDSYISGVLQSQFKPNTVACNSTQQDFILTSINGPISSCPTTAEDAVFEFDYTALSGFSQSVTFSATGQPAGSTITFTPASLNASGPFTMTVSGIENTDIGTYEIVVLGSSSFFIEQTTEVVLNNNCTSLQCTPFDSEENLELVIPDGTGPNVYGAQLQTTITIPDLGAITSLTVNVDITHTYIQDVVAVLYHPDLTTNAVLWLRDCLDEGAFDITFDDNGSDIVCADPTTGVYAPNETLSVFNGMDSAGDWLLLVLDGYNGDTGVVNDWSLEICSEQPLSSPELNTNLEQVFVYPNPNNGSFTLELKSDTSNNVSIDIYDVRGRKIHKQAYTNSGNFKQVIELGNIESGLYLMTVSDGQRKTTKRIIVK